MCGFAAVVRFKPRMPELASIIDRMAGVIRHRGPDDEGRFIAEHVAMGFRRLSILDISPHGHQPMSTEDGDMTLVFNGEIYNYIELRRELEALGYRFRSSGDTEVLLAAYRHWGSECLTKLNGMWAFLIYDRRKRKLFGSRDRFGIKPLYRYSDSEYFLFASEIKSIRACGLYRGSTNWHTASRYLTEGRLDDTHETFYTGIEQVPAGTAFELTQNGRFTQWRYWSLEETAPFHSGDPARVFAELFEDAVRIHMRSDVPVGVHLSGGLDSTSIACASARVRDAAHATEPLKAFSYIAPEFDETRYIGDTLEQTGALLIKLCTDPTHLWDVLQEALWFQDEPMHSMTPLVGYELMRLSAANGVKVILNGHGADEAIGGYGSYFGDYWCTLLRRGNARQAWDEIGNYVAAHGGKRTHLYMRQWRRLAQERMGAAWIYRRAARWNRRRTDAKGAWFSPGLPRCETPEERIARPADLNARLAHSVYRCPLPLYLRIEDRNSMAHSVEARLPFLDHRLVSLCFSLPAEWHLRGPWNKYVLREAMRGRIPESVRSRIDKMGFPTPAGGWFADTLYTPILDMLNSRAARERGIYDTTVIMRDMERHRRGEIDITQKISDVAQFEAWCSLDSPLRLPTTYARAYG
jgi:asparagine synthase (glutamine-hydrolysing)